MATLSELTARLATYQDAEARILSGGQAVTVDGDAYTAANIDAIQREIIRLEQRIAMIRRGGFARSAAVFPGRS
jgi:hypothetical protein